jgi:hypothetical protein
VAYVVTNYLPDEKARYEDTYHRVHKIEPVEGVRIETACKEMLDKMDEMLECIGRHG